MDSTLRHRKNSNAVEQCLNQGFIFNLLIDYVDKHGRITPVEIHATVINYNSDFHIIAICRNTTERKKNEHLILLMQKSIDAAFVSLFWIKTDGSIANVNNEACRSLEYTKEELLKLKVSDIDVNYNELLWPKHFLELKEKGTLKFNSTQITKNGKKIEVEIVANYIHYENEEFNCAFVRDITDRKKAEQALKESEEKFKMLILNINGAVYIVLLIDLWQNYYIFATKK